ncbi:phosphate-starvation-inducible protein PsiE [Terribacillus saccharophilus]|jgi:protein PsiE|uniref:Protein PsiE n=1 Tax=Terribacillus saccharophilus TaxID=361277 RepID=A0A268HDB6_9BACI|nr:phosphate-starvation-inducible protein PsiE [Terribacillus saccharophilus]PAD33969.1 phosphate-starvation-inducible protein PsiE [Terribacillus saccharophilus]PAD94786.1 phosphate-starvation-inducible protein PsiE [Terribacillus saccharophilus]PAD98442.1 phosphate-starvation-inducible protein PsiE [Terribacillus saccharophilus]PAE07872.1 phosphate-starvation-inducible protein PsiE [Terribacillus saccharophilus]
MRTQTYTKKKRTKATIATVLQYVLNVALILLAIAITILLVKELIDIITNSLFNEGNTSRLEFLNNILVFFLYFEFIAMIVKYFQEDYHFPIRYFLYIGITALIRLIVVYHESALNTLFFCGAILLLVICYFIMNRANERSKKEDF